MDTAVKKPIKFTYEDYLHFSNDKRYEIIDGEIYMVPSPGEAHQDVCANLAFVLRVFVKENALGKVYFAPLDVVFSETDVVQPDIMFISKERLNIITERNIQGAPDLIVEIISPSSDEYKDRVIKRKLYSKYGVKEYWLVDLEKKEVEVMSLKESGLETVKIYKKTDILESLVLKGIKIKLDEIF
ncbi:restriction endonuclease [Candidatus Desulfofervidus auxilii]|uniref:Restriction endonuclease n=1 Tax=Desulfofervidus auxilii TaxID=1621989 RepID=A0A7U4TIV4_DESA2|nr:Uma2 family endonuclease [Candidatus Desulfofervidus auxilii]AMM41866.1 restriction endonuclease [Candidatus Desulfofervidus auxilii]CAD7779954.1 Putative restriction endonuclease [Candidatus Methanoperedenaceae archaeon GB50]CAD7781242.1 Putative restriction endonuclease [Candidatus Methanoperedenaceae archaeon GB37]